MKYLLVLLLVGCGTDEMARQLECANGCASQEAAPEDSPSPYNPNLDPTFVPDLIVVPVPGPAGPAGEPRTAVVGPSGADGQPCTVTQLEHGALIECPDGSQAVIHDGEDTKHGKHN